MFDLNLSRRRTEKAVAAAVAKELLNGIPVSNKLTPNEVLAHHIGNICQRMDFTLGASSFDRVVAYTAKEMAGHKSKLNRVIVAANKASDHLEVGDTRRGAKSIKDFDSALRSL